MLETTLSTEFVPGTNLKGDVTGANWVFLLPQFELEQVVCLGMPVSTTLEALSRVSEDILVLCRHGEYAATAEDGRLTNVRTVAIADKATVLPIARHSADLVMLADVPSWRLRNDPVLLRELQRIVAPAGTIYAETAGVLNRTVLTSLREYFGAVQPFWLTPLTGEMHTAVPLCDHSTINYFLEHELYSSSLRLRGLKQRVKPFFRQNGRQSVPGSGGARPKQNVASNKQRLKAVARTGESVLRTTFDTTERFLARQGPVRNRLLRQGVLAASSSTASIGAQPPQYLRDIAAESGVEIDDCRWGLVAKGQYSSRKVLFFLFDKEHRKPSHVVKMTRDPDLNYRLENEYRGLQHLHERGFTDTHSLPRAVFAGYHNRLMIVGETAIDGVPFSERTRWTADCPYVHAVLDWLTDLGIATAEDRPTTQERAADALQQIFEQFASVYQLTSEEHAFLTRQIATVRHTEEAFPAVFQHGDPGQWNVLASNDGRIAFLDWEAAEVQGMPLWDVLHFMRSYLVSAARARGRHDRLSILTSYFYSETSLSELLVDTVRRYCEEVGLSPTFVEPLFYTCWMHRALKEATRLTPDRMERGHYVNVLRLCIEHRSAPLLRRLFVLDEPAAAEKQPVH